MRRISFLPRAFDNFVLWASENQKIHARIVELISDIERNPFSGIGKPEPLKHNLKGLWSRRITSEHRLIYQITDEQIVIVQCRFHYEK
jgi:toxin YoeB